MDEKEINQQSNEGIKNYKYQVEFGKSEKQHSQETKDEITELEIPGINFDKEAIRYYPNGMFASHILGFAQKNDGEIKGIAGIENEMNKLLSGKDGHISYQRDKYNKKLLDPKEVIQKPKNGDRKSTRLNS